MATGRLQGRLVKLEHEQELRDAKMTADFITIVQQWEAANGSVTLTADDQSVYEKYAETGSPGIDAAEAFLAPLSDRELLGLVKFMLIHNGDLSEEVADAN